MGKRQDPWTGLDPETLNGTALTTDPRIGGATAAADALSRRNQLRETLTHQLGRALGGKDLAVGVGIGLISSIPGTPLDEMAYDSFKGSPLGQWASRAAPEWLPGDQVSRVSTWLHRAPSTISLPGTGGEGDGVRDGLRIMGVDAVDIAEKARNGELKDVDDLFVLDGEDMVGAAAARWLTDRWISRRGWQKGERHYHEFKALTYGVNAVVTAPFNPNPIMMGLSAWHMFCAVRASRKLTDQLCDLADLALEQGRRTMADWDLEMSQWRRWSAMSSAVASAPILMGEARHHDDLRILSIFDDPFGET